MEQSTLTLKVTPSSLSQDIKIYVKIDDVELFQEGLDKLPERLVHSFDDTDGEHSLTITMSGKTQDHTTVDSEGNITNDVVVNIKDVEFDGINVDSLIWQLAKYKHDFNGSGDPTEDRFFGTMGCNGTITLNFTTPIYLWLLENM